MERPKIAVDFDNTIASHNDHMNVQQTGVIIDGAQEFLETLKFLGYEIWIFSARASDSVGIGVIHNWLVKYQLDDLISGITNIKRPDFIAFVDDRAIHFDGSYTKVMRYLQEGK